MTLNQYDVYIYITHYVRPKSRKKTIYGETLEHLQEWRRGVGVPRPAHPIVNVLWEITTLLTKSTTVRVITNSAIDTLRTFFAQQFADHSDSSSLSVHLEQPVNPSDPFSLTWQHKKYLKDDVANASDHSLFVYLEHDQLITQANLQYFVKYRDVLREVHLIPDFLRCELHQDIDDWVLTDVIDSSFVERAKMLQASTRTLQFSHGYSGMYVMDVETATRHFRSPMSSLNTILSRVPYSLRARLESLRTAELAAIGARYDRWIIESRNPDMPESDHVHIFDDRSKQLHSHSLCWHMSNNYAKRRPLRKIQYGQMRLSALNSELNRAFGRSVHMK